MPGYIELVTDAVSSAPAVDPAGSAEPGYISTFEPLALPDMSAMFAPALDGDPDNAHVIGEKTTDHGYTWGYSFDGAAYPRGVGPGFQQAGNDGLYAATFEVFGWQHLTLDDWFDGTQTTGYAYSGVVNPTWDAMQFWSKQDLSGSNLRLHVFYYPGGISPLRRWPPVNHSIRHWPRSTGRRVGKSF